MWMQDPFRGLYWTSGGPAFGSSSFGSSPGSGEFGADPNALSQTTREQWEMVPGHRDWEKEKLPGGVQLTSYTETIHIEIEIFPGGRVNLLKRPDLLAQNTVGLPNSDTGYRTDATTDYRTDDWGDVLIGDTWYKVVDGRLIPYHTDETVIVVGQPLPDEPGGTATTTSSPATAPPLSPAFTPTPTGSAVPGARSGAASGISEWLYKDSLGILYNGGSRDAFKQTRPVDTGSILGNYAINAWLSLSNVVAACLSAGVVIINTVDDFFNRHLGYGAIQTVLPMSKAMGIAVEAGPAIGYSAARLSTWWSAFSRNPRVVNSALAPIFGTLAVDGSGGGAVQSATSAANLEHVLGGGSGDRGIAVLHIDVSRLTPTDLETAVNHVRDMDFQAGIANGLVRTAVPSRSTATNSVAALGRESLSLSNAEKAGHLPDVAGGGSPLGPITGLPTYVNSSIAGQWGRYAPGFTFDGFSLIDRATGEFLYISLGLENQPTLLLGF